MEATGSNKIIMNSNVTLFGGKIVRIKFEPVADALAEGGFRVPPEEDIKVRQIPVREYDAGFGYVDDEISLVSWLCAKPKAWAVMLAPESFEEILATGREVNAKGFFSFCQRRTERLEKQNAALYGALANLPQETMKRMMELGLEKQHQSPSPILSPGFVTPPAR